MALRKKCTVVSHKMEDAAEKVPIVLRFKRVFKQRILNCSLMECLTTHSEILRIRCQNMKRFEKSDVVEITGIGLSFKRVFYIQHSEKLWSRLVVGFQQNCS